MAKVIMDLSASGCSGTSQPEYKPGNIRSMRALGDQQINQVFVSTLSTADR
jgi:hypothetical protein